MAMCRKPLRPLAAIRIETLRDITNEMRHDAQGMRVDEVVVRVRDWAGRIDRIVAQLTGPHSAVSNGAQLQSASAPSTVLRPCDDTTGDHLHRLLAQEGKPMNYRDLAARMQRDGHRFSGRTPHQSVGTTLRVDPQKRFKKMGTGMYGLTAWRS